MKRTKLRKQSKDKIAVLKRKLWKVFSAFIKRRDKGICFTCGRKCEGRGYHCGHYIPRSICGIGLYFDEKNNHGQCYNCNINLGGYGAMYHKKMIEKYGEKEVAELWRRKNEDIQKWSVEDYQRLIKKYEN